MKQVIFTGFLIYAFCFAVLAQNNEKDCPSIQLLSNFYSDKIEVYTAEISKEIEKYDVKYKWSVKGGKIINGENTRSIIFLREANEYSINLDIEGLPKNCSDSIYESGVHDSPNSILVDEFEKLPQSEEKARMDKFFSELQNNPLSNGLIVIANDQNVVNELELLNSYIQERKFDKARISFLITNDIKELTRMLIIPKGAENPFFKDSLIIKAEDFDQLKNLFRPKQTKDKNKIL